MPNHAITSLSLAYQQGPEGLMLQSQETSSTTHMEKREHGRNQPRTLP